MFSHGQSSFNKQVELVQELVAQSHFKSKPINDEMSEAIYSLIWEDLNKTKSYWTIEEEQSLETYKKKLDDAIQGKDFDFIEVLSNKYKSYLGSRINFLESQKKSSQDYSGKEKIPTIDRNNRIAPQNTKELLDRWSTSLRVNILISIARNTDNLTTTLENFKELEKTTRERIIEEELCSLKELLESKKYRKRIEHSFLNAFLHYHDPHSSFFNQDEKFNFEKSIAVDQESYGITVSKNDNNEFYITHIVPGSPAFKNINIEVKDIIKSLNTESGKESMICKNSRQINAFLTSPQHKEITIQLRKRNGTALNISLKKALLAVEDNAVRAFIIGENQKAGYIRIPSFYTDLESPYGLGLADDLAKEIYKLKKENISGLILDLRNNGGGSLKEAIEMIGMFINRGPVTILSERNKEPFTVKDFNRGSSYTDPLIILVNGYSASASELFAATMQDYQRAIIIGSSTYGKSTMQTIEDLSTETKLGAVKLTSGAFYRVNGTTHQGYGVQPDVTLPFLGAGLQSKEADEDYFLNIGTVTPKLTFLKNTSTDIPSLRNKSKTRLDQNELWNSIESDDKKLTTLFTNYLDGYTLDFKSIYSFTTESEELILKMMNVKKEPLFEVTNTSSVKELLNYNAADKEINTELLKSYLITTLQIKK